MCKITEVKLCWIFFALIKTKGGFSTLNNTILSHIWLKNPGGFRILKNAMYKSTEVKFCWISFDLIEKTGRVCNTKKKSCLSSCTLCVIHARDGHFETVSRGVALHELLFWSNGFEIPVDHDPNAITEPLCLFHPKIILPSRSLNKNYWCVVRIMTLSFL